MAKTLWFGTRGNEMWVKGPLAGGDSSRVGYSSSIQYINGGAGVVASQAAHREYNWSWSSATDTDDIRDIIDFAEGVYDTQDGVNLIYFVDPMAAQKNLLPQNWAVPSLGLGDGMPLLNDIDPQAVNTPANSYKYPLRGVRYAGGSDQAKIYIPIPPGYSMWLGVHGSVSGGGMVKADAVQGVNVVSTATLTMLGLTTELVADHFDNSGNGTDPTGVELYIDTTMSGATVTLYGMVAQLWPIGATPPTGLFISGQGHSGCQFSVHPTESPYYAAGGIFQEAATAKLVEVGAWL